METRRLLIAFVLSMAVLFIWYTVFPPEPQTPPPARQGKVEAPAAAPERIDPTPTPPSSSSPPGSSAAQPATAPQPATPVAGEREERVVVETDLARAEFTNRGAQLVSYRLAEEDGGEKGLELVRARQGEPWPFALLGSDGDPLALNDALFAVERAPDGRSVTFRYAGPSGAATKTFAFREDGLFDVDVDVSEPADWRLLLGPGLRNPDQEELESRYARRLAIYSAGGEVEMLPAQKAAETVALPASGLRWVGLEDTYFVTLVLPREGLERAVLQPVLLEPGGKGEGARFEPVPAELTKPQKDLSRDYMLLLDPEGGALDLSAYWGIKEYDRLAELGLEEAVDLGMFGFLVRPLMLGLHWIHDNVVPNYGWAIVIMTIIINLLLLPLTHKSYVSSRKMADVAPKINAIREKYRPKLRDKQGKPNMEAQQKMNQEIMALYKSEGVNPAGGCLPILLQMPVFFAFYQLLSVAVELRGAPWMLWIQDLSMKDPYYVLPIVMGATQFLQMRMMPMAGDPIQRRIFQLMPIGMTFVFLGFPSGLVLYWLTGNVLTIVRQWVYNHMRKRSEGGEDAGELTKTRRDAAR